MKRILYIVILLALAPTFVNALGLGKLDLNSALNEPFDARIQLLSPTADELDSLTISLADSEAFARAKVGRPFILSKLKFAIRRSIDDGPDYIRVFSRDPIREPFLNFLVDMAWSKGRLFREYTVLLDPPLYDPNARASEFAKVSDHPQVSDQSYEAVTIDDPDHKVVYADAFEQASSPVYTPNVNYTGGDYGPTSGSDTLWSIASAMRPDSSVSVNQMMLALLRTNPEAFINQNINGLNRGQILRMPNGSEINALTNAEALAEVQSQYAAWNGIKDNLSSVVTERPEVSSAPESSVTTSDDVMDSAGEVAESEPELKLVAAEDTGESTQQVSSVDSGTGENLVLAQESIQVLTHENLELKDQLKESEALLDDLKRLLSLKDDELAALQEQMATQSDMAVKEVESDVDEIVSEVEEEIVPDVEEEEVLEVVEEEAVEDEVAMDDAEDQILADEEEVVATDEELEVVDVIDSEPASSSAGIMGMVNKYLGPIKDILFGNAVIGMAIGGILLLLIIIVVLMKFKKDSAETIQIDAMTEEAFPDFSSGDLGDTGAEAEAAPDSEAATILPDSEAETAMPEESADLDIQEEEKKQFIVEETPVAETPVEEESDEDPLQEVNTYLAFEQFDQAEEFVRNVINDDPDNPEFHTKLLEVFYTSGDRKSYEEAAKVLHDKIGGEGEYWNMAVAMWQEMSPNRALFEEGEDDDDSVAETSGGGFVDVTADEEAGDDGSAGLDFDIGGAEETPVADEEAGDDGDAGLDFDIGGAEETPVAEVVIEADDKMLDITASDEGEDMLDVTAAVGLDEVVDSVPPDDGGADDVLDIFGSSGADSEELLELTTGDESLDEDLLDVTAAANLDLISDGDESSGEDLLDVTAAAHLDLDSEEDLLDVTAATSAGADSSELLDLELDVGSGSEPEGVEAGSEDASVDLDLSVTDEAEVSIDDEGEDNVLDFDIGSIESDDIEIETSGSEDAGLEIDQGTLEVEDEDPIRLDVEDNAEDKGSDEGELSIDFDLGDEGGIDLDLSSETEESPEIDLSSDASEEESIKVDSTDMDLDLSFDDTLGESPENDIDFDGTMEIPRSVDVVDEDEDDDDDEHTVFVPRAAQPEEQSAEDEIATKLDLAKAYVELGDKDSAKTILDEVMADGNEDQRKQAEDLLGQV